jgi:parallel beta-helix repeat protein
MSRRSLALTTLVLSLFSQPALPSEWFVAPNGNDAWSGRQPEAHSGSNDGPFLTFERARKALRDSRVAGDTTQQIVSVRAGTYQLSEAFVLEKADSGTEGAPTVWQAFAGEQPVISGATSVKGWTPWKDGIFKAPLEKMGAGKSVRQLLLHGKRQTLARYPNADPADPVAGGWAFADGQPWPMYADIPGEDKRTLQVRPQDWRSWAKPEQLEVFVFPRYNWWNSRVRVQSVDATARKVTLSGDCAYAIRHGDRYFIQNALEELDTPGEWYADPTEKTLYFWPPAGTVPEDATPVVAQTLLKIEAGAHDLVWSGFIMEASDSNAVRLNDTARCVLKKNWIRAVADWSASGISVTGGSNNLLDHNRLEQIGGTAISLSGGDIPTLTEANNTAQNNEISEFGIFFKQGVGIALSGVGNRALHNHIHHGPRFGVLHSGNRNEISFNHIHDVCLETEDTGAIYSGGRDWITPRGTKIAYNFIHDVPGFSMHDGHAVTPNFAWGIYLDDNSGGADVFGNIIARCGRGGMHGHGARDCVVQNNIFFGNKDWQVDFHGWTILQDYWPRHMPTMTKGYEAVAQLPAWKNMRGMDIPPKDVPLPDGLTMRGNRFEKNIVVSDKAETPVLSILRVPFSHNVFDSNLYWTPGGVVRTGFQTAGPDEGDNLIPPLSGESGAMPAGWHWSTKPDGTPQAQLIRAEKTDAIFRITCEGAASNKTQMLLAGGSLQLVPGASYRLRAKMRASQPGRATLAMQSFVPKAFFWNSPKGDSDISENWTERESVFEVPSPGKPGWNAEMKHFSVRIGWRCNSGALELCDIALHRVTPNSEWDSWRANGVDSKSLIADPLWTDRERFILSPESPAWKLGFERIPVEQIGPQNSVFYSTPF